MTNLPNSSSPPSVEIGDNLYGFNVNYFQLFGLPQSCRIDKEQLEREYRALQTRIHPDKSAHLSDAEQRLAMQRATLVNEACQILRNPLRRARYLLSLHGVDTQEGNNNVMPLDFLMEQMEWREGVSEAQQAHDLTALAQIEARIKLETQKLETQLVVKIDSESDYAAGAALVRKLRFMEKLTEEIHAAYDVIDT